MLYMCVFSWMTFHWTKKQTTFNVLDMVCYCLCFYIKEHNLSLMEPFSYVKTPILRFWDIMTSPWVSRYGTFHSRLHTLLIYVHRNWYMPVHVSGTSWMEATGNISDDTYLSRVRLSHWGQSNHTPQRYCFFGYCLASTAYEHRKQLQIHNLIRFRKITCTFPIINLYVSRH